ncbi:MAG: hypothetical protein ACK5O2_02185 [Microthrixaceae bacterium]
MHYQMVQLLQLGLSLLLMFAAFLGGLALGWWRWGRSAGGGRPADAPPVGPVGLFTPEDRHDEIILEDLATVDLADLVDQPDGATTHTPLFAATLRNGSVGEHHGSAELPGHRGELPPPGPTAPAGGGS